MLISVITATYNSEKGIQKVISSLQKQSHQQYEWIVVDGGSDDQTLKFVQASDIKVKRVISECDDGIYDALNNGLKIATGSFCIFLHSDDWWEDPEFLAKYITNITPRSSVLYSNVSFFDTNGKLVRRWVDPLSFRFSVTTGWMPPHVSMLVNLDLIKRHTLLFDTNFTISADYDWILKLAELNSPENWTYVPDQFVSMTTGGASNGSTPKYLKSFLEDLTILSRYGLWKSIVGSLRKKIRKIGQWYE